MTPADYQTLSDIIAQVALAPVATEYEQYKRLGVLREVAVLIATWYGIDRETFLHDCTLDSEQH